MLEETAKAASQAAGTLSQTTLGAILVLSWIVAGLIIWSQRKEIQKERSDHNATREARLAELKSQNQVSNGLLLITDGQKALSQEQSKMTSLLIDAISNIRRAG